MRKPREILERAFSVATRYLAWRCIVAQQKRGGIEEYLTRKEVFVRDGHFVYTKGGHGDIYVNIKALNVAELIPVAMRMAYEIHISRLEPDVIVGVPFGADILASQVALFYSFFSEREILNLKLIKGENGSFFWYKNAKEKVRGKNIILVEDVINTGGSLVRCGEFIRNSGVCELVCFVVCDRLSDKNPGLFVLGEKFKADYTDALISVEAKNYSVLEGADPREYCPFCKKGREINTSIGHGGEFLSKMKRESPDFHTWITGEVKN